MTKTDIRDDKGFIIMIDISVSFNIFIDPHVLLTDRKEKVNRLSVKDKD